MAKRFGFLGCMGFVGIVFSGLGAGSARAQPHSLFLSPEGSAQTMSGNPGEVEDEDILLYSPGQSSEPGLFIHDQNWEALIGDGDGDGMFDEEPTDVDALFVDPQIGSPVSVFDLWVSFTSDRRFASGTLARDGDIIQVLPGGDFLTIFSEEFFEGITATSSVDVDAFAVTAAGEILFSFAENEVTGSATLIAQNGGSDSILDGVVFLYTPGDAEAFILFAEQDVIDMVNNAISGSLTTIGDTQGLSLDPGHPGQFLFAVSSKSSQVEGTLFSTHLEGSIAELNGVALSGSSFGFSEEETLNCFCVATSQAAPMTMRLDTPDIPVSSAGDVMVHVAQGVPGSRVQIIASPAVLPITPMTVDERLTGSGLFFTDISSRLFQNTARSLRFRITLDEQGRGSFMFSRPASSPGLARVLQAIDVRTFEATYGIVAETVE